jgi:hypothetical protein
MVRFTAIIKRFGQQGEKTGWTYIEVPFEIAEKLNPGNRKGYRVKGKIDQHPYKMVALIPLGGGNFIMTLNAGLRKVIGKPKGATVILQMELDHSDIPVPEGLMECLEDEPEASARFEALSKSHRNYFFNWINSAKTIPTKTKRIAATVDAMAKGMDFGQMLRSMKRENT